MFCDADVVGGFLLTFPLNNIKFRNTNQKRTLSFYVICKLEVSPRTRRTYVSVPQLIISFQPLLITVNNYYFARVRSELYYLGVLSVVSATTIVDWLTCFIHVLKGSSLGTWLLILPHAVNVVSTYETNWETQGTSCWLLKHTYMPGQNCFICCKKLFGSNSVNRRRKDDF